MLRLILIVIVGIFFAVGALAVVLYHFLGLRGLILFPFVIVALLWVAIWLTKNLVKKVFLSLFSMKARALRGATMDVHSIKAIVEPPDAQPEPDDEDDEEVEESAEQDKKVTGLSTEKKNRKDYVELDVTITPKPNARNLVWEPTEFVLASEKIKSLADLGEKSIGDVHSVEIWDGTAFGPGDQDKYPGEQRLKIVFEVKPGSKSAWLCYYHEAIGRLELPLGTIEV